MSHYGPTVLVGRIAWLLAAAGSFAAGTTCLSAQSAPETPVLVRSSANLNINPKRITVDRLGRSAAIYIFNQGGTAGTFDIQLIDRLMLPSGQIMPLAEAAGRPDLTSLVDAVKSARTMVVATPRRVTLAPNSGQTIRVRASSATEIPPGEYRTHLTVTAIPSADTGLTAEQAATPREGQLSFRVNTVLGLSIPVIIRIGPVDVRAAIANPKLGTEDIPGVGGAKPQHVATLSFELVRVGVNSLFGDVEVRGNRERGDKEPIGTVRGIGVYPEIERRFVKIPLRRIPASGEQIEIVFRDDDLNPGKQLVRVAIPAP